jgi:AAA domain
MTKLTEDEMLDAIRPTVEKDQQREANKGNGHAASGRFVLKPFEDITLSTAPNYLVKGIIPRTGLAVVWGPPKCGKSFWTFDLTMHVALGWQYRGRRVQQGPVVYLALEGAHGFSARVEAWRRQHLAEHQERVPFYLVDVPVDLVADRDKLIAAIREQVTERPVAVVIDTLNRALLGDENASADMAKFIRAADVIRTAFGCLVIIIHHCDLAGSRPRGHTSLAGADDVQIAIERDADENIITKVEHMKDGQASKPLASRLELVELGTDDDGDPITTCIIVPSDNATGKANARLSPKAVAGLRCLQDCLADLGKPAPASDHFPVGIRTVTLKDWREYLFKHNLINREGSYREQFQRLHVTLKNAGAIGIWDEHVWTVT